MRSNLEKITCDLREYPNPRQLPQGPSITTGDMHANALRMLHFLCGAGILQLTSESYTELAGIYAADTLTAEHFARFETILKSTDVNREKLIRFIGDTLADRGRNDALILLIYKTLAEKGVRFVIMASNHDLEFIHAYESKQYPAPAPLIHQHIPSLYALGKSIDQNHITKEKIDEIYETVYRPRLKLLDWEIVKDPNEIIIYSHAPITIGIIQGLLNKFGLQGKVDTREDLINSIVAINHHFTRLLQQNNLYAGLDKNQLNYAYCARTIEDPLIRCFWNRELTQPEFNTNKNETYRITFVFGHLGQDNSPDRFGMTTHAEYLNTDTNFAKAKNETTGTLLLYSHDQATLDSPERPEIDAIKKMIDETLTQIINSLKLNDSKKSLAESNKEAYKASVVDCSKKYLTGEIDAENLTTSIQSAKNTYCNSVLGNDRSPASKAARVLLSALSNTITHVLIFPMAFNYRHYKETGSWRLFSRTRSQRSLEKLSNQLINEIKNKNMSSH